MYEPPEREALANELAGAFLASRWTVDAVAESGAGCLDRWPNWMQSLALSVVTVFRSRPVGRRAELAGFIEGFLADRRATSRNLEPPRIVRLLTGHGAVSAGPDHPSRGSQWATAAVDSVADLALRLELSDGQLAWLSDVRNLERAVSDERLRNYRYRAVPRRGGVPRVLEAPKARLKEIQRWILREILDHVPAHEAAQGFTRGRSVVTHAQYHTGRASVLRLDLKDFFASVPAARVFGIFRTLGYRRGVAHVLTGLSTNTIPQAVWRQIPRPNDPRLVQPHFWLGRQLATPHLPQGAPTSPALANLAAFRLDRRLTGLAVAMELRYSRYADDLTFSGSSRLLRRRDHFEELVREIAHDEGFVINQRKSALQVAASRQLVCGVVVNVRPNVARSEYDQLKAILHNAARDGPATQNRAGIAEFEAHLRGRVAWVAFLNPPRGERLQRSLAQIEWSDGGR